MEIGCEAIGCGDRLCVARANGEPSRESTQRIYTLSPQSRPEPQGPPSLRGRPKAIGELCVHTESRKERIPLCRLAAFEYRKAFDLAAVL